MGIRESIAQVTGSRSFESVRARFCRALLFRMRSVGSLAATAYGAPNMFFA